ncbi:uncharacterized protein LOC124909606 [Impatiens glandulifera]|uniref:uncharacterized protein LOC124909606 n=1 Tax=Impatiens glandulifera TaxID=253017 RepID=UPI001FB0E54C|nr:uncharacterized protein LOC124909606 [Impatiens glandulifera]
MLKTVAEVMIEISTEGHLKRNYKVPKRNSDDKNDVANIVKRSDLRDPNTNLSNVEQSVYNEKRRLKMPYINNRNNGEARRSEKNISVIEELRWRRPLLGWERLPCSFRFSLYRSRFKWISADIPHARIFSLKYKTNLTQWSGATLPMQEVSSMLLEKLVDAGIGDRPVVFVTHSMGGLVVKQILYQAKVENKENIVNNTVGVIFYSCPHFGSRLADMPWKMGLVLRPAPTIGELRSGSPRLIELNDFIRPPTQKGSGSS